MLKSSDHPFLDNCPAMQSSGWAEFQRGLGKNVTELEGKDWKCLLIEQRTRLGRYWLAPYGPVLSSPKALPDALQTIKVKAKEQGLAWVVIEPFGQNLNYDQKTLALRRAKKSYDPEYTVVNNLSLDEAKRFSALSPTYRNLINRAERRGLSFRSSTDPAEINIFTDMISTVENRNRVSLHNATYFKAQAKALMPKNQETLEIAYFEGKPVASCAILRNGPVAHYAYAGSYPEARKLEAGTVLLWHAMQNTAAQGVKWFDLFGVAPPDAPSSHPWHGFSTFKRKFGGQDIHLGGTWELPIEKPKYLAYRAALPVIRKLQKLR